MKENRSASLFPKELVIESLKQSFVKLDPRTMFRNPIMFIVEVVTFVMLIVTVWAAATGNTAQGSAGYNIVVFIVLFLTLLFANFAEAIAEARGKVQADSLRKTREETPAKRVEANGTVTTVSSSQLKKAMSLSARLATRSLPTARSSRGWLRSTRVPLRASRLRSSVRPGAIRAL